MYGRFKRGWRGVAGHDSADRGPGPRRFHDSYKEKIEAMIKSKMTGEVAQVGKKPAAKSMMEVLRTTA